MIWKNEFLNGTHTHTHPYTVTKTPSGKSKWANDKNAEWHCLKVCTCSTILRSLLPLSHLMAFNLLFLIQYYCLCRSHCLCRVCQYQSTLFSSSLWKDHIFHWDWIQIWCILDNRFQQISRKLFAKSSAS